MENILQGTAVQSNGCCCVWVHLGVPLPAAAKIAWHHPYPIYVGGRSIWWALCGELKWCSYCWKRRKGCCFVTQCGPPAVCIVWRKMISRIDARLLHVNWITWAWKASIIQTSYLFRAVKMIQLWCSSTFLTLFEKLKWEV